LATKGAIAPAATRLAENIQIWSDGAFRARARVGAERQVKERNDLIPANAKEQPNTVRMNPTEPKTAGSNSAQWPGERRTGTTTELEMSRSHAGRLRPQTIWSSSWVFQDGESGPMSR